MILTIIYIYLFCCIVARLLITDLLWATIAKRLDKDGYSTMFSLPFLRNLSCILGPYSLFMISMVWYEVFKTSREENVSVKEAILLLGEKIDKN